MPEELPGQPELPIKGIVKKPEQISNKVEIQDSKIDPSKDPNFKPGPKPHPTRSIYHEKNKDRTEPPVFKIPIEKPTTEERPMSFEESTKRLKKLIESLDKKNENK